MNKLFILLLFITVNSLPQNYPVISDSVWIKVSEGFQFCEGPAWDGIENLYVSDCYGKYIAKINSDSTMIFLSASDTPFTLNQTNGLAVGKNGFIYACDYGLGAILKISPSGRTEILANEFEGQKFNRPNDICFDINGNIYFTDPKSYNKDSLNGRIFRIDAITNELKLIYTGLGFPNGIKCSNDGRSLFLSESALHRVLKFDFDENGISNPGIFIELKGGDPDGLEIDKKGNLIVAHFGGRAVYIISQNGNIIKKIITPGKKPSNLEFGGENNSTLYLTETETGTVYKMEYDAN